MMVPHGPRTAAKFALDLSLWTCAAFLAFPLRQASDWTDFGAVIPVYGPDYQTYFLTKWKKEFRLK